MKKIAVGIIICIILTLCFYNVQAESIQVDKEQEEVGVQVESESMGKVPSEAKARTVQSAEENEIQPNYADIFIIGNRQLIDNPIKLILGEHETEKIRATYITNGGYVTIPDAKFSIQDTSIATIDETGVLKAKKAGTTTITATAGGKEAKLEVIVHSISFSDFSGAKAELYAKESFGRNYLNVKISGIKSLDTRECTIYYCAITSKPIKPDIITKKDGGIDNENEKNKEYWTMMDKENDSTMSCDGIIISDETKKEIASNKKAYLWIVQENFELDKKHWIDNETYIDHYIKFLGEGEEIDITNLSWIMDQGNSTSDPTTPKTDPTQAPGKTLPKTGIGTIIIAVISIIAVSTVMIVTYKKYDTYKQLSKFVK